MNNFTEFLANGCGWVLERVELLSVNIAHYQPIRRTTYDSDSVSYDELINDD